MLFSLPCQLHSDKKQAEQLRQHLLCVRQPSKDIYGLEATFLASFPALCWESHLVSRISEAGINWRYKLRLGLIVKEITLVRSLSGLLANFPAL